MSNKHISLAPVPTLDVARIHADRAIALSMWKAGFDTKDIASHLGRKESWVYNNLSRWRVAAKSEAPQ